MNVVEWKSEYSVGMAKIDEEHKKLVEMINAAHSSANCLPNAKAASELIGEMEAYAKSHFQTEERLMEKHNYPMAAQHIKAHQAFLNHVKNADTDFSNDNFVPGTVKIVSFLADWLVKHILETDKKLGDFLQEQGLA